MIDNVGKEREEVSLFFGVERPVVGGDSMECTIPDVHGFCSCNRAEGCEGRRDGGFLPVVSTLLRTCTQCG